jgi:hypothetical protein
VVLAIGDDVIWECAGPTDGDPTTANSQRSEIAGFAASLEVLVLLLTLTSNSYRRTFQSRITVQTWIDNAGAVGHLKRLHRSVRPSRAYPNDQDLLSHIKWLWTKLPRVDWKIDWVKGHQDSERPFEELQRNARLNVLADELATNFYHQVKATNQHSRRNSIFFPSSQIGIIVNGQRVTANVTEAIRYHISGTKMRKFLQEQRPAWSDGVWEDIALTSLGVAFKKLQLNNRFKVHKLLIGWLNTGHQRSVITKGADSRCPSCGQEDEDQEHVLRCKDRRIRKIRYQAAIKLRANIVTTKGGSTTWSVLHRCILAWLDGTQADITQALKALPMSNVLRKILSTAITGQERIGWNFALRGYLSSAWIEAQMYENPKSNKMGLQTQWLPSIISQLWKFYLAMWEARNEILHGRDTTNTNIRDSSVDERVRTIYSIQEDFAVSDQVLFDMPLQLRLSTSIQSKKHWLTLVGRYKQTTATRKVGNQPLITRFFTRHRNSSPPSQNSARQRENSLQDPPNIGKNSELQRESQSMT